MTIPVDIWYEDTLHYQVILKILEYIGGYDIGLNYCGNGFGNIKKRINNINNSANGQVQLVMVDLDNRYDGCPLNLINSWLEIPKHNNLIFRVCVQEVESWLLADRTNFPMYFQISRDRYPENVDTILDPKMVIFEGIKARGGSRMKEDLLPRDHAKIGPGYNSRMKIFIENHWDIEIAIKHSTSLCHMIQRIRNFTPEYR